MTLFEYLSSSMENMAQFVCDRAILSPCDIVCRGEECVKRNIGNTRERTWVTVF